MKSLTGKITASTTKGIDLSEITDIDFTPYHKGSASRSDRVPLEQRRFIAWDGEGISREGTHRPQSYVLFGCSTGEHIKSARRLNTFEILDFVVGIGERNADAIHVGFAFNYDANMILQSLGESTLKKIHKKGGVTLVKKGDDDKGARYYVQFRPSKWFSVTKYKEGYNRKTNPHAKITVRIYDIFGFFTCSFVKAYEDIVGPVPENVKAGKKARGSFTDEAYVEQYWRAEIVLLQQLAEELRRRLYGAGLRIGQWHGPGALASYALRQHGMKRFMSQSPEEVREAARYGYAGGRFEIFKLGRIQGPIYSLDINSAYPFGIAQLPNLAAGRWSHVDGMPDRLARFGIYRVRLIPHRSDTFTPTAAGPLFHRDKMGNISYPWLTEGWYWTPEVRNLKHLPGRWEILEGWEHEGGYVGEQPFLWVRDMYQQRREWKEKGYGTQLALKLCMNSLYGKMAQRVGWDEVNMTAPQWHQLEWAGWVTSLTRAMLWDVMHQIPYESLIAVETDGLYTTVNPEELGIVDSKGLGGWEVKTYDEILYVQSGMAWLRRGDEWTCKRRGLDARTFELADCSSYLQTLAPREIWKPYVGTTTRFIGMGAALISNAPTKVRHCRWETTEREIRPGMNGKRIHMWQQCKACADGKTAWEAAHDMSIRSLAYDPKQRMSYPHDIPWEGDLSYAWRDFQEEMGEVR